MTLAPVPPVLDSDRYVSYTPVSATTDFDITFPLFGDETDVEVYVDGVLKAEGTDYTVLSLATGATLSPLPVEDAYVHFSAAQSGVTVEIIGAIHPRRTVQATSAFTTRDFNYAFSLLTAAAREANRAHRCAVRGPAGEMLGALPSAADRASKYLVFDGAGAPAIGVDPGSIVATAFAETLLDDASATAMRSTLGMAWTGTCVSTLSELTAALASGGAIFVNPNTYTISSMLSITLTQDVDVVCAEGVSFVGAAGLTTQMFRIDGDGKAWRFRWRGGKFDATAVVNSSVGGDTGTVFDLFEVREPEITHAMFVASTDFGATMRGDTAIDMVDCGPAKVMFNYFYGWPDAAFYPTGGASTSSSDDGGPSIFSHNYVERCGVGVSSKRKNAYCVISSNVFKRCYVGVGVYEVGAGEIQPGQNLLISGNVFDDTVYAAVDLRGGPGQSVIANNMFYDVGYDLSGTLLGTVVSFVRLIGATDTIVSNNTMAMLNRAKGTLHRAILADDVTIGATTWAGGGNLVTGNIIKNVNVAVYEGSGVSASTYMGNDCSQGVGSIYEMTAANSTWEGMVAPGDRRMYSPSALMSRYQPSGAEFPSVLVGGSTVIDAAGGVRFSSYSAASIAAVGNAVNTANKVKAKTVWDETNKRLMVASGPLPADPWYVADGSTSVTPA